MRFPPCRWRRERGEVRKLDWTTDTLTTCQRIYTPALFTATFTLWRLSCAARAETILTAWPFTKKGCRPLGWGRGRREQSWAVPAVPSQQSRPQLQLQLQPTISRWQQQGPVQSRRPDSGPRWRSTQLTQRLMAITNGHCFKLGWFVVN